MYTFIFRFSAFGY